MRPSAAMEKPPVDAADFKAAMRVLAASVTVITSRHGDQLDGRRPAIEAGDLALSRYA